MSHRSRHLSPVAMRAVVSTLSLMILSGVVAPASSAQDSAARGSAARRVVNAVHRIDGVRIDGRLDDADWARAAPIGEFRQRSPDEGAASTQRTEVRVLYDADAIYVGARLFDTRPDSIVAMVGPRDNSGPADEFYVQFDSYNDRRSAFVFAVSAGGTKTDLRITKGRNVDVAWNAVWDAATTRDSLGWSAEVRIPLGQLRFAATRGQELRWGVNFLRWIGRRSEDSQWSLIPNGVASWVEYYGEMRGLVAPRAPDRMELQPYVVNTVALDGTARGTPAGRAGLVRPVTSTTSLGGDVRYALTPAFTLSAAVRPDFGQVEADPSEVNLTSIETFLEERRPLFLEGADLLSFSTSEWYDRGELFYSRRVGRTPQGSVPGDAQAAGAAAPAPILAAMKLAGKSESGLSIALFDAATGAVDIPYVAGDGAQRRVIVEPLTNFAAARVRQELPDGRGDMGVSATLVTRAFGGDAAPLESVLRRSAAVAGVDGLRRWGTANGYFIRGWLSGSTVSGSAAAIARTQRSGVHLMQRPDADSGLFDTTRTSLRGWAAGATVRKDGGNLKFMLSERVFSTGYEPNDLGYLARADRRLHFANIGYDQPRPNAHAQNWWTYLNQFATWDMSGRRVSLVHQSDSEIQFASYWTLNAEVRRTHTGLDPDALQGGPALRQQADWGTFVQLTSDRRRPLSAGWSVTARRGDEGARLVRAAVDVRVRPTQRLQLRLSPALERRTIDAQYVSKATPIAAGAALASPFVVAALEQRTASLTGRFTFVITPNVELQGYVAPFLSAGHFRDYALVRSPQAEQRRDRFASVAVIDDATAAAVLLDADGDHAADATVALPDFTRRDLNATATARWEFRPGSVLHLVWNRRRDAGDASGVLVPGRDFSRAFGAPGTDAFAAKLTYWIGR